MTLRRALGSVLLGALLANTLCGCGTTLDSLGMDSNGGRPGVPDTLSSVPGPASYANTFKSLLGPSQPGVDDQAISEKINVAFNTLFPATKTPEAIYLEDPSEQSEIRDFLHNDVRTEGIGLAMLILVELPDQSTSPDEQRKFDRLWRYAKANLQQHSGPAQGFFSSYCDDDTATPCLDTYGMQEFVLALMLANTRWANTPTLPYARDALDLLDLLRNGIGSTFDATTALVREQPTLAPADYTRSSLEMPGAYEYWAQATGNPFWSKAADAARAHLRLAADDKTGLWPMRSRFSDGAPVDGSPGFTEQAYRTQLNLALDTLWWNTDQKDLANRLLNFFQSKGLDRYGATFAINGDPIDTDRAPALISVNGTLAVVAPSNMSSTDFVKAVWEQAIPTGDNRYYEGLLYMMSLLALSGQLRTQWATP